jgi:ribonucleoside-diphosphate reductase alpha chain
MKFERFYSLPNTPVQDQVAWKRVDSQITDLEGNIIFEMKDIEVPDHWSQTATDILAQKYFRKAGMPNKTGYLKGDEELHGEMPIWLLPSIPAPDINLTFGSETSAKQVFHRLAGCWTYWGWREGILDNHDDAQIFYDELYLMLAKQIGAPNSPQWFNTGLYWAYGITGNVNGQWRNDEDGNQVECKDSYEYPTPHACFIQPVDDNLVNPGGIMDLWLREAKIFKYGSGSGTNVSKLRAKGELLSGGGTSSGMMSFLRVGDRAAGAIKSGGTTRRAALMRVCDLDHPEIEDFINWKVKEEEKAKVLSATEAWSPDEALDTVSGQNSNNSVRVTDSFIDALSEDKPWFLTERTTGHVTKVLEAKELWDQICSSAWECGDPGVQFHDTIQSWHTCKADGDINASNPCGEYLHLDNTACNLASLNLCKFLKTNKDFDIEAFEHATRLWTIVLEISVYMASFPSKEIALGSYNYRTLGLGYANLGALIMRNGLAYDSDEGRSIAGAITSLMTAIAYKTSAELAGELGPFLRFGENSKFMHEIIYKHYRKAQVTPMTVIDSKAYLVWKTLLSDSIIFRNAQVTLIAPTGTIALLMDCDTTGIEPDFALVKSKKLAGGGNMKFINQSVYGALFELGYDSTKATQIVKQVEAGFDIRKWIKEEHWPVFATAVGENCISPEGHVKMVAAVQPFLSGGVSKTVNMPNKATVADVDKIYRLAHKLGLKSISIYRDGCKLAQPLSSNTKEEIWAKEELLNKAISETNELYTSSIYSKTKSQDKWTLTEESISIDKENYGNLQNITTKPNGHYRGERISLPERRRGYTNKYKINGQTLYLHTGNYSDGSLGEIFVDLSKEGSTTRALMECFSKAISLGIQYGVPLEEYIDAFTHSRFEPSGIVQGHDTIKLCSSIVDLIFRDLGITYLARNDLGNSNLVQVAKDLIGDQNENVNQNHEDLISYRSGTLCPECGSEMNQTGTCLTCPNCGNNTGCG